MTYDRHVPYWYFVKVLVCRRIKFVLLCLRRAILQGIWSTTDRVWGVMLSPFREGSHLGDCTVVGFLLN